MAKNDSGTGPQGPQFSEDKHGPKYDNDVANDWRRGGGSGQAEGKPGFDKHKAGR